MQIVNILCYLRHRVRIYGGKQKQTSMVEIDVSKYPQHILPVSIISALNKVTQFVSAVGRDFCEYLPKKNRNEVNPEQLQILSFVVYIGTYFG